MPELCPACIGAGRAVVEELGLFGGPRLVTCRYCSASGAAPACVSCRDHTATVFDGDFCFCGECAGEDAPASARPGLARSRPPRRRTKPARVRGEH